MGIGKLEGMGFIKEGVKLNKWLTPKVLLLGGGGGEQGGGMDIFQNKKL